MGGYRYNMPEPVFLDLTDLKFYFLGEWGGWGGGYRYNMPEPISLDLTDLKFSSKLGVSKTIPALC